MEAIFGKQFRDKYSGFVGTAVGHATYETSADQILLIGQDLQNGRPVTEWFDAGRLEPVNESKRYGI